MKKLLKSDICGSHKQCTGPTVVIKGRKSKKSAATVHAQQPLSPAAAEKKKKKKGKKKKRKEKTQLTKCNAGFSAIQMGTK